MMIRLLFWPAVIRSIAEGLKKDGRLNRKAARFIDYYGYLSVVCSGLFVFLLDLPQYGLAVCIAVFMAGLIYSVVYFRVFFFPRLVVPYVLGDLQEITVRKVRSGGYPQFSTFIEGEALEGQTVKIGRLAGLDYYKKGRPVKGQLIEAFVYQNRAMPNLDYFKNRYSLVLQ